MMRRIVKSGEQLIDEWGLWIAANEVVGAKGEGEGTGRATGMTLTQAERNCADMQRNDRRYPEAKQVNAVLRELPLDEYDACYHCRALGRSQDDYATDKGTTRPKVKQLMTQAEGAVYYAINCGK